MNSIINNYLITGFLKTIFNVILVFICLGVILNLFEEIEFFKKFDLGLRLPILLTIMYIPNLIIKLLPFIIFISAMWYLISIKSNKDLLTLKVFGFSNLKIIFMLALTAFLFGAIIIVAVTPVTSLMVKFYEQTKSKYSRDIDHLFSVNKNGLWIKEINNNILRITSAKSTYDNYINDITVYEINKTDNKLLRRIESNQADISQNQWVFKKATIYMLHDENEIRFEENFKLSSIYNVDRLNTFYRNLDTISFVQLINEYDLLLDRGYNKEVLNEQINIFFALPVFLFLMVILASIFTMGNINKSQNFYYVFVSIITCVIIYYFKDLSIAMGQTNRISLMMSVWMPILAIGLFCTIGILQINEK